MEPFYTMQSADLMISFLQKIKRNLPLILIFLFFCGLFALHRLLFGGNPHVDKAWEENHLSAGSAEDAIELFGDSFPIQGLQSIDAPTNWVTYELEFDAFGKHTGNDPADWKSFYTCIAYTDPRPQIEFRLCFDPDDSRISEIQQTISELGEQTGMIGETAITYGVLYAEDRPRILQAILPFNRTTVLYCFNFGTADDADSIDDALSFLNGWLSQNRNHPLLT